jgi:hypothetical protein
MSARRRVVSRMHRHFAKELNRDLGLAGDSDRPSGSQILAADGHHSLAVLHGHSRQTSATGLIVISLHLPLSSASARCRVGWSARLQRSGARSLTSPLAAGVASPGKEGLKSRVRAGPDPPLRRSGPARIVYRCFRICSSGTTGLTGLIIIASHLPSRVVTPALPPEREGRG